MNSYVSVEEEELQCDDGLDSLVLSASNIFEAGLLSKCADGGGNLLINSEELGSPNVGTAADDFVCVTGNNLGTNIIKTRSKAKLKSLKRPKESNFLQHSKIHPEFEIDGKLISLDVDESYENLNSLDIECLPFETVLMNYPGEVDYFDLNDKFLNISQSPNPFDSDQESESFDGFSENSNSSFEGFNDHKPNSQTYPLTPKSTNKTKEPKLSHFSEEQKGIAKLDFNCKSDALSESIHKATISPVFGDQRVTSLNSKTENFVSSSKRDFNSNSTTGSSLSQPRPVSVGDKKLPKNNQNYSKSATSPFCYSTATKFKEKANESGTMQQKSKKERVISQSCKNNNICKINITTEIRGEPFLGYNEIFSDDSDLDITFEGFQENFENLSLHVKNEPDEPENEIDEPYHDENEPDEPKSDADEPDNIEEFIGINCDKIGCTISWLESKQAKNPPQLVNNGIVYELSEFAKKIAWEPEFIGEWVCRLKGYLNIKISNEDMRKINIILRRRKALTVNFAGKYSLKSKLANFDTELFILPSIENIEAVKIVNEPVLKNSSEEYFNEKADFEVGLSKKKDISNVNIDRAKKVSDNMESINSEDELKLVESDLQKEAVNYKDLDKDESTEMEDHSDMDGLFESSDLEVSDKDSSDYENNLSQNSNNKVLLENRISGRVRKPTAKAQESYSIKYYGSATPPQNISPMIATQNVSPIKSAQNISPTKPKILHPVFNDDGKDIGPHCKAAHIDIKLLNSSNEASFPITKGVVYELYHFFRERKASLTSLVHTLYRLKNIPFDKSQIIATMAKIHEMVKVMWKENIDKDKNMPYEEVNLLDFESSERIKPQSPAKANNTIKQKITETVSEPLCKKRKQSLSTESLSGKEYDSNSESSTESLKENSNKSFDLNSTKGFEGRITRGDIVYLYTKWLKKKMEGQSNVFVTDLSKDVEELIIERRVECIRIPVGTLMSSSVKLFEEFRKLSKVNMLDAKTYLLEDWIDDIKCILSSTGKKPEGTQDSNITKVSNANIKHKFNKNQSLPMENTSSSKEDNIAEDKEKNITEPKLPSSAKKSIISGVSDDYEVEKIVGYRIVKMGEESITEYRIRWLGFSSKDDSWINEADLNCPEILARFWEALNKQRALKSRTDSLATENCSTKQSVNDSHVKTQSQFARDSHVKPQSQSVIDSLVQSQSQSVIDSLVKPQSQSVIDNNDIVKPQSQSVIDNNDNPQRLSLNDIHYKPQSQSLNDSHVKSQKIGFENVTQKVDEPVNQPTAFKMASMIPSRQNSTISEMNQDMDSLNLGQENISPFFGKETKSSHTFFNIMINGLKPDLVDYQHEEGSFSKRIKITKGEILALYDDWRLQTGENKIDVNILISKIKDFVASKKVRNFNPSSIIDTCYRMSLMRAKLKESNKINEYLSGDFIELMQMSQKHQEFVRSENADKLKKIKQGRSNELNENEKLNSKINNINNLERESLIIARYLDSNKNKNIEKDLESNIVILKKKLSKEQIEESHIGNIKRENLSVVKELEAYGVAENTLDEILNIATKIKI